MFRSAQNDVDAWISQFEEGYWSPLANLARLAEEVGELAREINAAHGEKPKKASEGQGSVGEEIADCMFVLIAMANSLGIDLDDAFEAVLRKYRTRDAERWTRKDSDE